MHLREVEQVNKVLVRRQKRACLSFFALNQGRSTVLLNLDHVLLKQELALVAKLRGYGSEVVTVGVNKTECLRVGLSWMHWYDICDLRIVDI